MMVVKATKDPNKYAPPSPRKILALGKLKRRNEIKMTTCPVKKNENSISLLFKFINNKTVFMIIKFQGRKTAKFLFICDCLSIDFCTSSSLRCMVMG